MQARRPTSVLAALGALALFACACGSRPALADEAPPPFTRWSSFAQGHPDLYWRNVGVAAYERGSAGQAFTDLQRAARYADKPAQAMIAQMLWNGEGVAQDRALAYVWADLAAERGYPAFIATRERFWNELDAAEQQRALGAGSAVYAEYGDAVAKRRAEAEMLRARRQVTGSRTGHVGTLTVNQNLGGGRFESVDAALYYADTYWRPKDYWQWQDRFFEKPPEGKVEVGPLQTPPRR